MSESRSPAIERKEREADGPGAQSFWTDVPQGYVLFSASISADDADDADEQTS